MWLIAILLAGAVAACSFQSNGASGSDAAVDATPDASPDAPIGPPTLIPEIRDYGTYTPTGTSLTGVFTVTSISATAPILTSITGTDASDFTITSDTCTGHALPVLSSCTIVVRFQPQAATGMRTGTLDVTAGTGAMLTSMLRGRYDTLPDVTVAPTALSFGTVHVGTTSGSLMLTLHNPGTIPTPSIGTTTMTGADAAEFSITSDTCNGLVLGAMSDCTLTVTYSPNGVGARSATITVAPFVTVPISGTGEALTIVTTPAEFGAITVGQTSLVQTLTVTNVAANAVGPLASSRAGNHPTEFVLGTDTCNGTTLAPAATCTIDVRFAPTVVGPRNALVRLMTGTTIIADGILRGTGEPLDPVMISPGSFTFGDTTVGQTSTAFVFTVFNMGTLVTGTFTSALVGTDPGEFAIVTAMDTCTGAAIPGGGMCTIGVTFTPTSTGQHSAALSLSSTPGGTHMAALTGTAL